MVLSCNMLWVPTPPTLKGPATIKNLLTYKFTTK